MTDGFSQRIDRFVRASCKDYVPSATGKKIIHDPIWGSVEFYPWEVRLIDSPLFQRMRDIHQVGLATSSYPAAHHTRFDHSLGTAAVASRMMERLMAEESERGVLTRENLYLLRLAALLHDIGHCVYSHLSEAVYGSMPSFEPLRAEVVDRSGQDVSPSPHEVFSYLIMTSDAFLDFFRKVRFPGAESRPRAREILLRAANLVVGAVNRDENGNRLSFLTHILNGNFDADKLDYTQRDSYTAGIALTYGVERFLLKLVLCRTEEDGTVDYRLAITSDALSTVEELIFNRSMLYRYMYRHQKVVAAEAQMRDALYALVRADILSHPCDFLELTERELGVLYRSSREPYASCGVTGKPLKKLYRVFSHRALHRRAFSLSPEGFSEFSENADLVSDALIRLDRAQDPKEKREILLRFAEEKQRAEGFPSGIAAYVEYLRSCDTEQLLGERRRIADAIRAEYGRRGKAAQIDALDLSVFFPPFLHGDLSVTVTDKSRRLIDAAPSLARIREWTDAFNRNTWRGYLFVAPHVDREIAGTAFRAYLLAWCNGSQHPLCPKE